MGKINKNGWGNITICNIIYRLIGNVTNTQISLMYIDKIAKKEIVDEIKRRLKKINTDSILDSGNIEEFIKDDRYSIFPTFLNSEKPDSVTVAMLEGRVAIFVDGSAYVLTAPAFFVEFLHAGEDYYHHFIIASMVRIIRYIAFFLSMYVPAIYIALTTFHQEMIPTPAIFTFGLILPIILVIATLIKNKIERMRKKSNAQ